MNVLLVDDDPNVIVALLPALKSDADIDVRASTNGDKAIEHAESLGNIDLLITDVVMEPMDGFTLRDKLTQRFPEMRTIFITGYDLSDYPEQTKGRQVLIKPIGPNELLAAIDLPRSPSPSRKHPCRCRHHRRHLCSLQRQPQPRHHPSRRDAPPFPPTPRLPHFQPQQPRRKLLQPHLPLLPLHRRLPLQQPLRKPRPPPQRRLSPRRKPPHPCRLPLQHPLRKPCPPPQRCLSPRRKPPHLSLLPLQHPLRKPRPPPQRCLSPRRKPPHLRLLPLQHPLESRARPPQRCLSPHRKPPHPCRLPLRKPLPLPHWRHSSHREPPRPHRPQLRKKQTRRRRRI